MSIVNCEMRIYISSSNVKHYSPEPMLVMKRHKEDGWTHWTGPTENTNLTCASSTQGRQSGNSDRNSG